MENIGMFIMGCVVCALYLSGYLYMIKYANDSHDSDLKKILKKLIKANQKNNC
jgi:hypothetical protein